jgi:hypothetical protein
MALGPDDASLNGEAAARPAASAMESLWRNFIAPETVNPAARPALLKAEAALNALVRGARLPAGLAAPAFKGDPASLRVQVYAASQGSAYNLEQRDALVASLRALGAAAEAGDESDFSLEQGPPAILVAPHEFITVSQELRKLADKSGRPGRRLLLINTAAVASEGFIAMAALNRAGAFVQWDLPSAVLLKAMGVPAYFMPPVFPADVKAPIPHFAKGGVHMERRVREFVPGERDDWEERPLDVASFNIYAPWLRASLAKVAQALSARACMLIRVEGGGLVRPPEGAFTSAVLARRAKIVLRLNANALGMDSCPASLWGAWLGGALLFSEPGLRIPGFSPRRHYVECAPQRLHEALAYYLDSEQGRAEALRIRADARQALAQHFPARRMALGLLGLLAGEA